MTSRQVYVSITGLKLRGPLKAPRFWWHAIGSMMQAKRAPGNISADARMIEGIQHTLSVWESQAAMRAYLIAGAHGKAMANFKSIATGKVVGFLTDTVPDWSEVHALWIEKGREV